VAGFYEDIDEPWCRPLGLFSVRLESCMLIGITTENLSYEAAVRTNHVHNSLDEFLLYVIEFFLTCNGFLINLLSSPYLFMGIACSCNIFKTNVLIFYCREACTAAQNWGTS